MIWVVIKTIEVSILRSHEDYENERAGITAELDPGEDPIDAMKAARSLLNSFLGPSLLEKSKEKLPEFNQVIIPAIPVIDQNK